MPWCEIGFLLAVADLMFVGSYFLVAVGGGWHGVDHFLNFLPVKEFPISC